MSLIFLGRVGTENYVEEQKDGSNVYKTRPSQQFAAGVMIVRESAKIKIAVKEPTLGADGKPLVDGKGEQILKVVEKVVDGQKSHSFNPNDIGKPFDGFENEADVMARYPGMFKKA